MAPDQPPATILIVDDELDLAATYARLLTRAGYRCLTAHSGPEAMALIDAEPPGLVVTDLRLPSAGGLAVTRHARRRHVPVVLMTAYASPGVRAEAERAGAAAFLAKPFTATDLLDAVRHGLAVSPA